VPIKLNTINLTEHLFKYQLHSFLLQQQVGNVKGLHTLSQTL